MTRSQGDLASLSRFVFRTPDWSASVLVALLVAAVAGVAAFDYRFVLDDAYQGIVYIGVPTLVAAFGTPWVDRRIGGRLTYNRSALLALVCEVILVVFLVVGAAVAAVVGFWQQFVFDALVVGLASIFAFRLFVILAISRQSILVAAVPASIQTATAAALAFVYSGTLRFVEVGGPLVETYLARPEKAPPELSVVGPDDFLVLAALCGVYAVAVWVFVAAIDRPWRRALGVSVLDFVGGFVGHVAEGSRELETFFEDLGEAAVVPVTVMGIRRPDGTEKARFVLDRAHDRIDYAGTATRSLREREGESKLLGQAFGDDAVVVATHAPGCADDVDFSVGLSTAAEVRTAGIEDVLLVDAHNCNDGLDGEDLGHVVPGSRRSFDLMTAAGRLGGRLADADRRPLRVGVAWDPTDWTPAEGIGPLGVRVAVVEVGAGEAVHRTVYCLVDGNNMDPGVREELLAVVDADAAEVMTTDTHVVNTMEATNQVGDAVDVADLAGVVEGLVAEATADLEPVEAGLAVEHTEVTVFGNDRTEALASTANAVIQIGGALLGLVVAGAMALSLLILLVAG
ncbi:DUF2070 domain-containing protein [Halobacteriales archaeon QS_1_69_70]|nr:MAG: DUF2070 domain-containing protein [Halobacteriales archaeon QS_1_69_70]